MVDWCQWVTVEYENVHFPVPVEYAPDRIRSLKMNGFNPEIVDLFEGSLDMYSTMDYELLHRMKKAAGAPMHRNFTPEKFKEVVDAIIQAADKLNLEVN